MSTKYDFDSKVHLALNRDEAIVLFFYLSREIWNGEERLQPSFEHEAEAHSLNALLQELIPRLIDTGAPADADAIHEAAVKHLMARFE